MVVRSCVDEVVDLGSVTFVVLTSAAVLHIACVAYTLVPLGHRKALVSAPSSLKRKCPMTAPRTSPSASPNNPTDSAAHRTRPLRRRRPPAAAATGGTFAEFAPELRQQMGIQQGIQHRWQHDAHLPFSSSSASSPAFASIDTFDKLYVD